MSVKDRLLEFCNIKGIRPSRFEREAGLSNGYLSKLRHEPSRDKLDQISKAFPDLNISWLITGNGSIIKCEDGDEPNDGENITSATLVPLIPLYAQAGTLNDFVESVRDIDCEKVISPISGADFAITISGESMSPEYPSGSRILIKKIDETAFIEWGRVYVLDTSNGTVVKEVRKGNSDDEVICYSLNPDPKFQPFTVKLSNIFGFYKVLLCLSLK